MRRFDGIVFIGKLCVVAAENLPINIELNLQLANPLSNTLSTQLPDAQVFTMNRNRVILRFD